MTKHMSKFTHPDLATPSHPSFLAPCREMLKTNIKHVDADNIYRCWYVLHQPGVIMLFHYGNCGVTC
jgi:hypothetical protein